MWDNKIKTDLKKMWDNNKIGTEYKEGGGDEILKK